MRLAFDPEDARDLVQETILRAARALSSVPQGASHEEAWLVRTLVNLSRDGARRRRVRQLGQQAVMDVETRRGSTSGSTESALLAQISSYAVRITGGRASSAPTVVTRRRWGANAVSRTGPG